MACRKVKEIQNSRFKIASLRPSVPCSCGSANIRDKSSAGEKQTLTLRPAEIR